MSSIPFDELPVLDKASYYIAYLLYKPSNLYFKYNLISPDHVSFAMFISIAVGCIVVGSYATIGLPKNAVDPESDTESPLWDAADRDNSQYIRLAALNVADLQWDRVTLKTTLLIPVLAGSVLCGLYYVIKNYSIATVMKYFRYHINLTVVPAAYYTTTYVVEALVRKLRYFTGSSVWGIHRYRLTLSQDDKKHTYPAGYLENELQYRADKDVRGAIAHYRRQGVRFLKPRDVKAANQGFNFVFDDARVLGLFGALVLGYLNYSLASQPWLFSNIVGINFAIFGIKNTVLSSFKIALLLLIALFFYDIYFVFKTDIMLTVATKLDIPIKIVLPRQPAFFKLHGAFSGSVWSLLASDEIEYADLPLSLLGLGDVVVPGLFVSLCLRYDLFRFHALHPKTPFHHLQPYSKPFFVASLVGYCVGLLATFVVLSVFNVGQPALLYIVPSVLGSVFAVGLWRGELGEMWRYDEEIPQYKKEQKREEPKEEMKEEQKEESVFELLSKDYGEETDEGDLTFDELIDIDNGEEDEEEDEENEDEGEQTDLDVFVTRVYLFDTDSDDDTFLIESESDNFLFEDEDVITPTEIEILKRDRRSEPRIRYDDEYLI